MDLEKIHNITTLYNEYHEKEYFAQHIKSIVSNSKFAVGIDGSHTVERLDKVLDYSDIQEIGDLIIKKCDEQVNNSKNKLIAIK